MWDYAVVSNAPVATLEGRTTGQRASILQCLDRPIGVVKIEGKIDLKTLSNLPLMNSISVFRPQTTVQSFIKSIVTTGTMRAHIYTRAHARVNSVGIYVVYAFVDEYKYICMQITY